MHTESGAVEETETETTRVWLVERTYSDDEQNIIILVYATPDGAQYYRKERALVSFSDRRDTTAAVEVSDESLGRVEDAETRQRYADEVARLRSQYDPGDAI